MNRFFTCLLIFAFCSSCHGELDSPNGNDTLGFDGTGYVPVYATDNEYRNIELQASRTLKHPGKIYKYGAYLFVNELGEGIHLINNSDPRHPENEGFISIPGNYDMAAKGTFLYADNLTDLVVLDISNPKQIRETKRIENAIEMMNFPQERNVYFECVDTKKGIVVSWKKVAMDKAPGCRR
jgi:hypothetical protein